MKGRRGKKSKKKVQTFIYKEDTCLNCPVAIILGKVDFNSCTQSLDKTQDTEEGQKLLIKCIKRPELGVFEPNITFQECPLWINGRENYFFREYPILTIRKQNFNENLLK